MSSIRLPSSAYELLPFCRPYDEARDDACFDTYARLVTVAACLGYRLEEGPPLRTCQSFLKNPSSIDLSIFRSQNLFNQLLILSMLCHPENEKALNERNLVQVIESLAERGFSEMSSHLSAQGPASFPETMAGWMIEPPKAQVQI